MKISAVIPIYNERENISPLLGELTHVFSGHNYSDYEIIAVNDGSIDGSLEILREVASKDQKVKVISFLGNHGQTAALRAGIDHASGDIIVTIDGDLENNPTDIASLIAKLSEGYDVVSGFRESRWRNDFLLRRLPSVIANQLISFITGLKLHDYGCTLKAYRRHVIENTGLYGEMHRFIPAYAFARGARVTEINVAYRPRIHGKSHYGLMRTYKVLLDLIVIKFLDKYMDRPMHFFGGIGVITFLIGVAAGIVALVLKIFNIRDLVATPLPILSALFVIVGVQLIAMGIIAEILMRTYYESQGKKPYRVAEKINFK